MKRPDNLYFSLALIGFTAVIIQTVFFRELIAIFNGNELIFGLTLALWLLTSALGAGLLGRVADRVKDLMNLLALTQIYLLTAFPVMIFFIRTARNLLGLPQGILLDLRSIILISLIALCPITIVLGFQFALGSKLLSERTGRGLKEIGRVYLLEALGSVMGGLLLSSLLLFFCNSFQLSALLALLFTLSIFLLARSRALKATALIITFILLLAAGQLERVSSQQTWKGYDLVRSADSPYGKIAVIRDKGESSFFEDGSLVFSTANKAGAEEFAHLCLLAHPAPNKVLLIGGGLGGAIAEIIKHPVRQLDYLELDPRLIALAPGKFPPRVRVLAEDGIRFIKKTGNRYDLVLVNLREPHSALVNRYFTREFYQRCRAVLAPDGILVFTLGTSADYVGREMRQLNASILKTAGSVFPHIAPLPGSTAAYFFAGNNKVDLSVDLLLDRWQARKISTEYFNPPALRYDLLPERIKYLQAAIKFDDKTRVNTDLNPSCYYYNLLLWIDHFAPPLKAFFNSLVNLKIGYLFTAMIVLALAARLIFKRSLTLLLACLGFAGMTAQIMIILVFQSSYGYVYQMVGLLTATFMAGLALGSYLTNRRYESLKTPEKTIVFLLFALLAYLLAMIALPQLIPFSSLIIGGLVGAVFPLAVKVSPGKVIGQLAGRLYGADLLGSSLAAILVSIFFVPIYGLIGTGLIAAFCVLCALVAVI